MTVNSQAGIVDISIGSGDTKSLSKFWKNCLNNKLNLYDLATDREETSVSLETLLEYLTTLPVGKGLHLWCYPPGLLPDTLSTLLPNASTPETFIDGFSAALAQLKNGNTAQLTLGSIHPLENGYFDIISLRLELPTLENSRNCYAMLSDFSMLTTMRNDLDSLKNDNIHEWTLPADAGHLTDQLATAVRPTASLASFCTLSVRHAHSLIHEWLTSIARTALALHQRTLPASQLPDDDYELPADYITYSDATPWICPPGKIPSASCFVGVGSGYHVVQLVQAQNSTRSLLTENSGELFVFSAPDTNQLSRMLTGFCDSTQSLSYEEISTQACILASLPASTHRLAIVAKDKEDLIEKLKKGIKGIAKNQRSPSRVKNGLVWNTSGLLNPKIAGILPGQGAQRFNMLKALCLRFPAVRDWFDNLDQALVSINGILPSLTLFPPAQGLNEQERGLLLQNLHSQEGGNPAVIVSSIALHELLASFGCNIDVLVGHSSGEISAMIISKALQFKDRADLFNNILNVNEKGARGNSRGDIPKGKFLAVTASKEATLDDFLHRNAGKVYLAMDNCPQQKVLFFPFEHFDALQAELVAAGVICFSLYFDRAYHTPLFEPQMPPIRRLYDTFTFYPPQIPIFSCINLNDFPDTPDEIKEWAALNWTHCVRFKQACELLAARDVKIFLELGPGGVLSGFVDNTLSDQPHKALMMEQEGTDSYLQLLNVLGNLFVEGVNVDFSKLYDKSQPAPVASAGQEDPTTPMATTDEMAAIIEPPAGETIATPENINIGAASVPFSRRRPSIAPARAAIVQQHFELMSEFLEAEKRIMGAFFNRHNTSAPTAVQPAQANETRALHLTPGPVTGLPMIGELLTATANKCQCKRIISRKTDLFLQHHTFGQFILKKPKNAEPLPIVPLAMTMEMMAEAASLLAPENYVVAELSEFNALRWLSVENETIEIMLDVTLINSPATDRITAHVRVTEDGHPDHPFCTGNITLTPAYAPPPSPMAFSAPEPKSLLWSAEEFFEQCLFHGEAFSFIEKLTRLDEKEIEVAVAIPPKNMLFLGDKAPLFKTAAQLLDVPGQAVGYWKVELKDRFFGIYPVSFSQVRFYGPPPAPGAKLICRGTNTMTGSLVDSNFEILYPGGEVYMTLSGVKFIYYKLEGSFLKSHYWTGPNTFYSDEILIDHPNLLAFEAKSLKGGFMEQSDAIWSRTLVHMYCNAAEKEQWHKLPANSKRRTEWLLGRIAAKEIVRKWAFNYHFVYVVCPDIEIGYDGNGRPYIISPELERFGELPDISIAHSNGNAVAIVTTAGNRVGIDLEYFAGETASDRKERNNNLQAAFSQHELDAFAEKGNADLYILVSAKEAASKAIGNGLLDSLNLWTILDYTDDTVKVGVMDETIDVHILPGLDHMITYCLVPEGLAKEVQARMNGILA